MITSSYNDVYRHQSLVGVKERKLWWITERRDARKCQQPATPRDVNWNWKQNSKFVFKKTFFFQLCSRLSRLRSKWEKFPLSFKEPGKARHNNSRIASSKHSTLSHSSLRLNDQFARNLTSVQVVQLFAPIVERSKTKKSLLKRRSHGKEVHLWLIKVDFFSERDMEKVLNTNVIELRD